MLAAFVTSVFAILLFPLLALLLRGTVSPDCGLTRGSASLFSSPNFATPNFDPHFASHGVLPRRDGADGQSDCHGLENKWLALKSSWVGIFPAYDV